MIEGLRTVETITIFAEDLAATKAFYLNVFGLRLVVEDEVSAVFRFDNLMLNVLLATEAAWLVAPAVVGATEAGPRFLATILVADADATCAELAQQGVALLNGPMDRPWGRRTAAFRDPAGNVWEIAQVLRRGVSSRF